MKPLPEFTRQPAVHGLFWLRAAFALFRGAPMLWLLMFLSYNLLLGLLTLLPWMGTVVASLLRPVFSVGFLAAAWAQSRGQRPRFEDLFRGFQSNLGPLLGLGTVQLAGIHLALLATALVDGGTLVHGLYFGEPLPDDFFLRPETQWAMIVASLCSVPVVMALWFSPALVVFEEAQFLGALLASLRASFGNARAFLVFVATLFMLTAVLPALPAQVLILLLRETGLTLALLLLLPLWLATATVVQISTFVSYVDVFHPELTPKDDTTSDDAGQ